MSEEKTPTKWRQKKICVKNEEEEEEEEKYSIT